LVVEVIFVDECTLLVAGFKKTIQNIKRPTVSFSFKNIQLLCCVLRCRKYK